MALFQIRTKRYRIYLEIMITAWFSLRINIQIQNHYRIYGIFEQTAEIYWT
jgi:hypothetical protein